MVDQPIIEVRDLEVRYKHLRAVDGLNLAVLGGEIFGLLGPNGAGKTTTLACIEGLRRPDAGGVRVAGRDAAHDAGVKRLLGVQLQSSAMFSELRITELLELYAALYEVYLSGRRSPSSSSASAWPRRPAPAPSSFRAGSSSAWRWR
jgi:ABC-type multidrug transport system ATPase subunit